MACGEAKQKTQAETCRLAFRAFSFCDVICEVHEHARRRRFIGKTTFYSLIETMTKNTAPTKGEPQKCGGCGVEFPSRNAVFKHLRETDGACLSGDDILEFRQYVRATDKGIKVNSRDISA